MLSLSDHIEAKVKQLLADLGGTADAVAEKLLAERCQGVPTEGHACSLTNYLRRHLPRLRIETGDHGVTAKFGHRSVHVPHTDSTAKFVAEFDCRKYPLLISSTDEY